MSFRPKEDYMYSLTIADFLILSWIFESYLKKKMYNKRENFISLESTLV